VDAAVSGQPSADATRNSDRDVEGGKYRISVRSLLANRILTQTVSDGLEEIKTLARTLTERAADTPGLL